MKTQFPIRARRAAFTLIELLIVIAIIAILAAILFPVFSRARENARRTSCLNNLKQIGLGVMQYTQDYDESYPINYSAGTNTSGISVYAFWMVRVYPYIKSTQVFVCPSATRTTEVPATYNFPDIGQVRFTGARNGNYGANEYLFHFSASAATVVAPIRLSSIGSPSVLVMGGDASMASVNGAWRFINPDVTAASGTPSMFIPGPPIDEAMARHLNGSNLLYADGHVKFLSQAQMGPDPARAALSAPQQFKIAISLSDNRVQ